MAKFSQPGTEVDLDENLPVSVFQALEQGDCVVLIWSQWGLESVHNDPVAADRAIERLRGLGAYRDGLITFEIKPLNSVV